MPETAALQLRHFRLKGLEMDAGGEGHFRGYAAIFNAIDAYGTKFERGSFRKTLSDNDTRPLLAGHDPHQIIGIVKLAEDGRGLVAEGQLNMDVARAREIRSLMLQKAIGGMSIGFLPRRWRDLEDGTTVFDEVELIEVSVTPFPAQKFARVEDVRSLKKEDTMEIREIETKVEQISEEIRNEIVALKRQVDAVDLRTQRGGPRTEHGSGDFGSAFVRAWGENKATFEKGGRALFSIDAPWLTRTVTRPSVLPQQNDSRIGAAAAQPLSRLLDALPKASMDSAAVYSVKEASSAGWTAGIQATEGAAKATSDATFTAQLVEARTIATIVSASKQSPAPRFRWTVIC
jgi:HK97 family phage prohead protease